MVTIAIELSTYGALGACALLTTNIALYFDHNIFGHNLKFVFVSVNGRKSSLVLFEENIYYFTNFLCGHAHVGLCRACALLIYFQEPQASENKV